MDTFEDFMDEVIKESAKTLKETRAVNFSLLRLWTRQNLNYQYSKMEASGLMISHTSLARLCRVSPVTEKKWFNYCEAALPGIDSLSTLSKLFGCTLFDLIEERHYPLQDEKTLPNNYPDLSCEEKIADFKSKCAKSNVSLRQIISKNLEFQYSLMLKRGENINYSIIARLCGVSPPTVHRWFNNGERLPGIDDLKILSFIFDCEVSDLVQSTDNQEQHEDSFDSHLHQTYTEHLESLERYNIKYGDDELLEKWKGFLPDGFSV